MATRMMKDGETVKLLTGETIKCVERNAFEHSESDNCDSCYFQDFGGTEKSCGAPIVMGKIGCCVDRYFVEDKSFGTVMGIMGDAYQDYEKSKEHVIEVIRETHPLKDVDLQIGYDGVEFVVTFSHDGWSIWNTCSISELMKMKPLEDLDSVMVIVDEINNGAGDDK